MSDSMKDLFGKRFREAREQKKLSRAALALRLDISPKTIQSWEMGRTFIENLSLIPAIESELGVPFTSLIQESSESDPLLAAEEAVAYGTAKKSRSFSSEKVIAGPQRPLFHVAKSENLEADNLEAGYVAAPLVKGTSAALPVSDLSQKDIIRHCVFPAEWTPRGRLLVAYSMSDSALSPTIPRGATVLVDRRNTETDRLLGRCVALWLHDRGLRIRRLLRSERDPEMLEGHPALGRTRGRVELRPAKGDEILGPVLGFYGTLTPEI